MKRILFLIPVLAACAESDARQLVVHVRTTIPVERLDMVDVDLTVDGERRDGATLKRDTDDRGEIGSFGIVPETDVDSPKVEIRFGGAIEGTPIEANFMFDGFHANERVPVFVCLLEDEMCEAQPCPSQALSDYGAPDSAWDGCLVRDDTETRPDEGPDGQSYAVALGGAGDQEALGVVRLLDGTDVVVGRFTGTIDLGGARMANGVDGFVAALNEDGSLRWWWWLTGPGDDAAVAVAELDGTIYVTGAFSDELRLESAEGSADSLTAGGGTDPFVLAISDEGTMIVRAALASADDARATSIAASNTPQGNSLVSGGTHRARLMAEVGGCDWQRRDELPEPTVVDQAFVLSLDGNFDCRWGVTLFGSEPSSIDGVAIEENGVVFAAGRHLGTLPLPGFLGSRRDALAAPSDAASDAFVASILADGLPTSIVSIAGPGEDRVRTFAAGHGGAHLLLTGSFGRGPRRLDDTRTIGSPDTQLIAIELETTFTVGWVLEAPADATVLASVGSVSGSAPTIVTTFTGTLRLPGQDAIEAPSQGSALARIDLDARGAVQDLQRIVSGRALPTALVGHANRVTIAGDYSGALDHDGFGEADGRDAFILRP